MQTKRWVTDGAHAGTHGCRVVRVGGVAEEDQSGAANRVERAENGTDVAGVLGSVERNPAQFVARPHGSKGMPTLAHYRREALGMLARRKALHDGGCDLQAGYIGVHVDA